ncbi:fungal specific transcription factor domain-containing protein [Colletotrichum orchidophilum]|uniref:Fungal specific transcription factor domain-containing protein n=1 Tax=Colletotrichum orchidophilum TaxID=1209926 RepID=A0A1G4AP73_9PEZI|nr:fungal specific transcription factor domain-containing protein [Colletotrichum orchidophilum]OHE90988.1 fungal specific transcription factor domain-containing protein [Colletotrichum orchidophilum]
MAVVPWPSVPNLDEDGDIEFPGVVLLKQQQETQQETHQHYHYQQSVSVPLSQRNYFGSEREKQGASPSALSKDTDVEVRKHSLDHHVSRDLDLNLTFSLDLGIDRDIDLPAAQFVDAAESGILTENNYNAIAGPRQQGETNPTSVLFPFHQEPPEQHQLFATGGADITTASPTAGAAGASADVHFPNSISSISSPSSTGTSSSTASSSTSRRSILFPSAAPASGETPLDHSHAHSRSHSLSLTSPPLHPRPHPHLHTYPHPRHLNNTRAHQKYQKKYQKPYQRQQQGHHHQHHSHSPQRASRACETCHARKVRCDAASLGVPCTNCVAFQIECRIPTPKRKKTTNAGTNKDSDRSASASPFPQALNHGLTEVCSSEKGDNVDDRSPRAPSVPAPGPGTFPPRTPAVYHTTDGTPSSTYTESQARKEEVDSGTYLNLVMKPKFTRAPITDAGRVAYLGESSNLTLLVHDRQGSSDVVHYPLPENVRGSRARLTELDNVEIDILHQRGAFLLPPRSLCDELIDSYFKWIHPIVPVINRTRFMRQYRDPKNPPSLLLLQAVLLAGSRVCTNPQLMDANGSTTPAALTFYKRAKALYDANYEDDRVTIVQSLLLMGWYWEGPEDVTKNVFYWSRVATIVAQGSGMHRSVEQSQLSRSDKRLWKRIWWTLFTRDRSVAVALGRPVHINLDDSDVEMLTEDDFIEDDGDRNSEYPPDPIHVQFFMQYVKLCEIMGLVLSQQYSVASKGRQRNAIDLTHSDMALADWLQNCPKIVYWEVARHHFWSALLHSNYYTTLCLLHRAHMPPNGGSRFPDDSPYPSRNIAFQAAAMITSIIENLAAHGELRFCPAFVVYSLFSALIMHVYQMRSPVPSIQQVTQDRLRTCMQALKEVSRVWLVGKMVYTLFESIIGNKVLEERLQKAAGKRHRKAQQALAQLEQQQRPQDVAKRKYDDMAIDFSVNTPTPQESYERSRPQTPSHMKGDGGPNQQTMPPPITSPNARQNADTFMGGTSSRPQTRPATPFNPSFSVPATPPDLYLVTRNSPNISQSLWENFQPDQLFPDSASMPAFPHMSPPLPNQQGIDAGLMAQLQNTNMQSGLPAQNTQFQPRGTNKTGLSGSPSQGANVLGSGMQGFQQQQPQQQQQSHGQGQTSNNNNGLNSNLWTANFDGLMPDGQSPSDSWSTGSAQGQPVPNTLNVEDWFQFFGINNGDLASMNLDLGLGPQ